MTKILELLGLSPKHFFGWVVLTHSRMMLGECVAETSIPAAWAWALPVDKTRAVEGHQQLGEKGRPETFGEDCVGELCRHCEAKKNCD